MNTAVRQTTLTYIPAALGVVTLGEKIFGFLKVTPSSQDKIVLAFLVSIPVAVALAWIFSSTPPAEGKPGPAVNGRRRRAAIAAVPTVAVAAALVIWVFPLVATGSAMEPLVSVAQFRDDSPKGDHAYLANGLAEELALVLGRVPGIQVMDRPESAAVIIEGAVSRRQDTLRVTAKLFRNSDKRRLGSFDERGVFADVFAMQDSLSQAIVRELLPHIPGGQAKGRINVAAPNPVAYDFYLRARYARDHENNLSKADSLFQQSVIADPSFVRARRDLSALQDRAQ